MKLDVEKSKLMGGDLENTHFVKGFNLMNVAFINFFIILNIFI